MKNNDARRHYTPELKELIVKRLEPPTIDTVTSISKELNVSRTSIYQWLREKNNKPGSPNFYERWTSADKFHVVLETSTLSEEELADYCRRKGLLVKDVKAWKEQCKKANTSTSKDPVKLEADLKEAKQKAKALEKELLRKERALAEAAAILVLRKKADAIWGDLEED